MSLDQEDPPGQIARAMLAEARRVLRAHREQELAELAALARRALNQADEIEEQAARWRRAPPLQLLLLGPPVMALLMIARALNRRGARILIRNIEEALQ